MVTIPFFVRTVGRRKKAVAELELKPGLGKIQLSKSLVEHSHLKQSRFCRIQRSFKILNRNTLDIKVRTRGGGITSQVASFKIALARALVTTIPTLRGAFRAQKFLTRDEREKGRRKYGLKKARKSPQFSKR